jgi:ribonuclease R
MMPRSESKAAYQLVEECMLLANRAVAKILGATDSPALYRVHEEPDDEQWDAMGMELQALGIPKLPHTRAEINQAVEMAKGTPIEYTANFAILRNFKRAEYSSTQIGHFGLAFDDYTHFTSPIRRYPDLLIHRLLKAAEQTKSLSFSADQIDAIALHCNDTERKADELERKSIDKKRMDHYLNLLDTSDELPRFTGFIVSIKHKGMIIELPDSLQRGMIPFSSITSDWLEANDALTQVKTSSGKVKYTIGDQLEVALAKVDIARGFVDFVLADQVVAPTRRRKNKRGQPDLKTGKSQHRGKSRRRR